MNVDDMLKKAARYGWEHGGWSWSAVSDGLGEHFNTSEMMVVSRKSFEVLQELTEMDFLREDVIRDAGSGTMEKLDNGSGIMDAKHVEVLESLRDAKHWSGTFGVVNTLNDEQREAINALLALRAAVRVACPDTDGEVLTRLTGKQAEEQAPEDLSWTEAGAWMLGYNTCVDRLRAIVTVALGEDSGHES